MTTRYENGKIYTIRNHTDDEIYVGSTCLPLSKRLYNHKLLCKHNRCNMKIYDHVDKLGGWDNFFIELHENYPCETKNELLRREGQVQRELKASLNKRIAGRTYNEWHEENRATIQVNQKNYREANREKLTEQSRQYWEKNRETLKENMKLHQQKNKEAIRAYKKEYADIDINKGKIKEEQQRYQEVNKDKIREQRKAQIECECGSIVRKAEISRHKRTDKHKKLMLN